MNCCIKVLANFDEVNGTALESYYTYIHSASYPNHRVKMLTINKLMWEQRLGHSNPALVRVAGTYTHTAATVCKPRDVVGLELPCRSCPDRNIEGMLLELAWGENSSSKTKMLLSSQVGLVGLVQHLAERDAGT